MPFVYYRHGGDARIHCSRRYRGGRGMKQGWRSGCGSICLEKGFEHGKTSGMRKDQYRDSG